jgi:hypothetical protein
MVQSLLKQQKITNRYDNIIGGLSMMQSLVIIHPFQLPAGVEVLWTTHHMHYLGST